MESTCEIKKNKQVIIPSSIFLYLERQYLNLVLPEMLYSNKTSNDYYATLGCCLFLFLLEPSSHEDLTNAK